MWDPTITLTGTGALNPVRDISDVVTVGTRLAGRHRRRVTAAYVAEGVEATDATLTLVGPKISTQQGRAFVQFTIEASQDWDTLSAQLAAIADAKNTADASMFLTGSGTTVRHLNYRCVERPDHDAAGALTVATLAAGDSWLLKAVCRPGSSTSAAAPATWDAIFSCSARFDHVGAAVRGQ
jgi:hypothetical protein